MGTNYYAETSVHGVPITMHIGKSSIGWKFLFAEYDNLQTWTEWRNFLNIGSVRIKDEYDRDVTFDELSEIIEVKQKSDNWDLNNAPSHAWGDFPGHDRSRHERLDEHGYRFSRSSPDDWS